MLLSIKLSNIERINLQKRWESNPGQSENIIHCARQPQQHCHVFRHSESAFVSQGLGSINKSFINRTDDLTWITGQWRAIVPRQIRKNPIPSYSFFSFSLNRFTVSECNDVHSSLIKIRSLIFKQDWTLTRSFIDKIIEKKHLRNKRGRLART